MRTALLPSFPLLATGLVFATGLIFATASHAQGGGAAPAPSNGPSQLFGLVPSDTPAALTLPQVLEQVATASFDLRVAKERIIQQQANVRRGWAMILPQVTAGGNYTYSFIDQEIEFFDPEQQAQQALLFRSNATLIENTAGLNPDKRAQAGALEQAEQLRRVADDIENTESDPIIIQPAHALGGQLQVSMPIFGGRSMPLLQNAYDAVEIAEVSSGQARAQLLFAATQAYYGAVTAKKMVGIADKQLTNAQKHRDDIDKRVELGALTRLNLQRAELDVVRAEQQLRVARHGVAGALGALGVLMDREAQFDVVEPDAPRALEGDASATELALRAVGGRDDVEIRKIALRIAERSRIDAWAQFLPSVNLSAQGRYTSNTSGLTSIPFTGAVVLSMNIPIFDGGTRYAALSESRSRIREEMLKLQQARRQIESQVRGNIADIAVRKEALETAIRALDLSRATHNNAKDLFELGAATSLDVIDASLGEFFADIELARAELDLQQSRLGLAFVIGEFDPTSGAIAPKQFTDQDRKNANGIVEMGSSSDDDAE